MTRRDLLKVQTFAGGIAAAVMAGLLLGCGFGVANDRSIYGQIDEYRAACAPSDPNGSVAEAENRSRRMKALQASIKTGIEQVDRADESKRQDVPHPSIALAAYWSAVDLPGVGCVTGEDYPKWRSYNSVGDVRDKMREEDPWAYVSTAAGGNWVVGKGQGKAMKVETVSDEVLLKCSTPATVGAQSKYYFLDRLFAECIANAYHLK